MTEVMDILLREIRCVERHGTLHARMMEEHGRCPMCNVVIDLVALELTAANDTEPEGPRRPA